jgi:hypothetical protein
LIATGGKEVSLQVFDIASPLPALRKAVAEIGDVRLAVIDPAISHVSDKVDPNSSTHVRHAMDALSDLVRETGIALVASA